MKRCIGIDIGSSYLCAVQILHTPEEFYIEKVFSTRTQRSTDSPSDILKHLFRRYGFDRHADVSISMPHDAVFFRNLETDFAGLEQIQGGNASVLEHNLPIPLDEIVAQVCSYRQLPDEKYCVLVAAAKRASLHERLDILAGAKIHPKLVQAAVFAIHSTIAVNHPEMTTGIAIIAYIVESYLILAITQNNNILIVRNIPIASCSSNNVHFVQEQVAELLSGELKITWQKTFGGEIKEDTKIYLLTSGNFNNGLKTLIEENLQRQTIVVDVYAKVRSSSEYNDDAEVCIAEGLALNALAPGETTTLNFLEADDANAKPALDLKREFIISAILIAAIVLVSLAGLFLRLSHLETKYAQIKNEIIKIFQRTLPEETNIVSPLVQLEQKLESLQKDSTLFRSISGVGAGPLETLRTITTSIPPGLSININDILITTKSVRLRATCDSFESVYQWKKLLQAIPEFALVDVPNPQKESESGVIHFTILISSAIPEQK